MLLAKPMQVFCLHGKQILACRVPGDNPNEFLDKELRFYASGRIVRRIRIEGISTASDPHASEFDFHYSGEKISPDEITDDSLLADGPLEEARQELALLASEG